MRGEDQIDGYFAEDVDEPFLKPFVAEILREEGDQVDGSFLDPLVDKKENHFENPLVNLNIISRGWKTDLTELQKDLSQIKKTVIRKIVRKDRPLKIKPKRKANPHRVPLPRRKRRHEDS